MPIDYDRGKLHVCVEVLSLVVFAPSKSRSTGILLALASMAGLGLASDQNSAQAIAQRG